MPVLGYQTHQSAEFLEKASDEKTDCLLAQSWKGLGILDLELRANNVLYDSKEALRRKINVVAPPVMR